MVAGGLARLLFSLDGLVEASCRRVHRCNVDGVGKDHNAWTVQESAGHLRKERRPHVLLARQGGSDGTAVIDDDTLLNRLRVGIVGGIGWLRDDPDEFVQVACFSRQEPSRVGERNA